MKDLVEYLAKNLVDKPDAVRVRENRTDYVIRIELRVDAEDKGKVIGREGVTINAIRSLLTAGSAKKGLRCTLEIVEGDSRRDQ